MNVAFYSHRALLATFMLLLLIMITFWQVFAQQPRHVQYRVLDLQYTAPEVQKSLNDAGAGGWELVSLRSDAHFIVKKNPDSDRTFEYRVVSTRNFNDLKNDVTNLGRQKYKVLAIQENTRPNVPNVVMQKVNRRMTYEVEQSGASAPSGQGLLNRMAQGGWQLLMPIQDNWYFIFTK